VKQRVGRSDENRRFAFSDHLIAFASGIEDLTITANSSATTMSRHTYKFDGTVYRITESLRLADDWKTSADSQVR
jgi:hypothetical protein